MSNKLTGTRNRLTYKRYVIILAVLIGGMAAVFPILHKTAAETESVDEGLLDARRISYHQLMTELQTRAKKFPGEAGILIRDLRTEQTITINSEKLFPSASLVKLPIMAAVYQAQEEGKLKLTDELTLQRKHKVRNCSNLYYVRRGTKIPVRDIVELMITESDNTATNMLVDALGFGYLNQKFVEFGLKQTDLRRGVMDLKWRRAGIENYTTAEDMAFILEKIYRKRLVSERASEEMLEVLKRQKVNDRLPRWLPDNVVIAHKTGLLHDTVSDVGIVFTTEGDFIICVLTKDIRSFRSAKKFIGRVAANAYDRCYKKTDVVKS